MLFVQGKYPVQLDPEDSVSNDVDDVKQEQAVHDVGSRACPVNQAEDIDVLKKRNECAHLRNEDEQRDQDSECEQNNVEYFAATVAVG